MTSVAAAFGAVLATRYSECVARGFCTPYQPDLAAERACYEAAAAKGLHSQRPRPDGNQESCAVSGEGALAASLAGPLVTTLAPPS